ncbi:hypothetical protein BDV36DRAFT_269014 [Aspergillus pseudocaelatus]|uniref:Uncharacterized protein n=1 Tax=Aspergillus pseudocaelatus TaxID=1825620 RepID=A0ABQ6WCU6_9EURO|nr:hypothetical protein BDV36DRAFT_269014 [Aspergillus pseudocaelatus]
MFLMGLPKSSLSLYDPLRFCSSCQHCSGIRFPTWSSISLCTGDTLAIYWLNPIVCTLTIYLKSYSFFFFFPNHI